MSTQTAGDEWQERLDRLHQQVLLALEEEGVENDEAIARLAADYESYCRMGHAPARAVRLAEQLLSQQGQSRNRDELQALALAVTARLARIYRDWQAIRQD